MKLKLKDEMRCYFFWITLYAPLRSKNIADSVNLLRVFTEKEGYYIYYGSYLSLTFYKSLHPAKDTVANIDLNYFNGFYSSISNNNAKY